nr:hypothetical protein [Rhizobium leguminosarum]
MKIRERAVDDCAEDAAFSPSKADGAGVSFNDGKERLGEMAKLAGFNFYLLSVFPRAAERLSSKTGRSATGRKALSAFTRPPISSIAADW